MSVSNGINHKCPCCGYEVKHEWRKKGYEFVKGDEPFIKIENGVGRTASFETDKERYVDWGPTAYETVYLLGCPKCGCVSFQFC